MAKKHVAERKKVKSRVARELGCAESELKWLDGELHRLHGGNWNKLPGVEAVHKSGGSGVSTQRKQPRWQRESARKREERGKPGW